MGYDPQRHWEAGDRPADVFVLGDFQSSLGVQTLNLDQISQMTGSDLSTMRISDVPFLQGKSISEVAEATPALKDFTMEEIPALDGLGLDSSMTLGEAMELDPSIGEMDFSAIAGDSAVTDVPNLDVASMDSFEDWQATAISEVPGLGDIPMGSMSNGLGILSGLWGKFDMPYGPKEHTRTPTKYSITGSNKDGFTVQCKQSRGCAHIELSGFFQMHGAQWISGGTGPGQQMVNGGEGVLGAANGGKEPTGRHPYGDQFKVVLSEVSESEGSAKFSLYFKYCYRGIPDLGCTPYFLGPVPMPVLDAREKGLIITGLLDGQGGLTSGLEAPGSWEQKRPRNTREVDELVQKYGRRRRRGFGLCGEGPGGVSFEPLAEAFSSIEGDYDSVGTPTGGGVALGRYQYMTYREDVRAIIRQKEGGAAFLSRADAEIKPTAAEVRKYFPAEEQDALFKEDQTRNIQQALDEGFSGSRLIERVGQIHYGGSGATIDGGSSDVHGRLTLKTYGEELAETYHAIESSSGSNSSCSAPTPVEPLKTHPTGTLAAQEYGASRDNGRRKHAGQDIDLGPDDFFQSYIGGEVVHIDYDAGGYYHYADIYNKELDVVERIAELDTLFIQLGSVVEAGQVVGQGTRTTGVVHLEYRPPVNDRNQGGYGFQGTYDPVEYLESLGVVQRKGLTLVPIER